MKKLPLFLLALLILTGCAGTPVPQGSTALPETTAVPTETTLPPDPMEELLDSMTLRQKVGQLFIARPEQLLPDAGTVTRVTPELEQALAEYPLGGLILFGDNVVNPEQLLALNGSLADMPGIPMFIAVDEEGGLVARLAKNPSFNLPRYQNAMAVGASGDPADALEMGRTIGGYLKEYGFNVNFAPVADVNTNPKNTIIGSRAFSSKPETAAQMAAAMADGLREEGIIPTFKHFPGHGDTAEDSHDALAVSQKTAEELAECEWIPFESATEYDMIMVGHIALPNVFNNRTPATMSEEIVTEVLKNQLGFQGLVVTDSMEMGAITAQYTSDKAALYALKAGCDIILMPANLETAFEAVVEACETGELSKDHLDATVERILRFKEQHGILGIG